MAVITAPNDNSGGFLGGLGGLFSLAGLLVPGAPAWMGAVGKGMSAIDGATRGNYSGLLGVASDAINASTPQAAPASPLKPASPAPQTQASPQIQAPPAVPQLQTQAMPVKPASPDWTERDMMKKGIEAEMLDRRWQELVAMYGRDPETDWTARQQMLKGIPDSRLARFAAAVGGLSGNPQTGSASGLFNYPGSGLSPFDSAARPNAQWW